MTRRASIAPSVQRAEALRILAGCAQGATEGSLAVFGIERRTLDQLVRAGKIQTWVVSLRLPNVEVRWYRVHNP